MSPLGPSPDGRPWSAREAAEAARGPAPTAREIAAAVRAGTVSAVEVVARCLERVRRAEPVLHAFAELWEDAALRTAEEVDARLSAGEQLPLAGVPVGVKGRGPGALRRAAPLLDAGCVPVGATSVPGPGTPWRTWGLGAHGRTVNPWRTDQTPGGSSAGSAAAVAAGLLPLATGSDGAGSVRIPAAWCGVVGLKSTNGLFPSPDRTGLAAAGVLGRTADDVAAWWEAMRGGARATGAGGAAHDARGTAGAPRGARGTRGSSRGEGDAENGTGGMRDAGAGPGGAAGTGRSPRHGQDRPGPTRQRPDQQGTARHRPDRQEPTGRRSARPGAVQQGPGAVGLTEPPALSSPPSPPGPCPRAVWSADLGFDAPQSGIVAVARDAVLRLADAGVLRPVGPLDGEGADPPVRLRDPASAWAALRARDPDPGDLTRAARVREANDRALRGLFGAADLLLTPVAPTGPHGHKGPGTRCSTSLTWAFNLSGHPALSLPAGLDEDGCPVGLHLVARHGEEELLLRVARAAAPWTTGLIRPCPSRERGT